MKLSIKINYTFTLIFVILMIGTVFFHSVENWSYVDSFYFSTMTLTTIGYGDFVPTSSFSKISVSIYSLLGIGIMLFTLTSIIGEYMFTQEKHLEHMIAKLKKHRKEKKKKK